MKIKYCNICRQETAHYKDLCIKCGSGKKEIRFDKEKVTFKDLFDSLVKK